MTDNNISSVILWLYKRSPKNYMLTDNISTNTYGEEKYKGLRHQLSFFRAIIVSYLYLLHSPTCRFFIFDITFLCPLFQGHFSALFLHIAFSIRLSSCPSHLITLYPPYPLTVKSASLGTKSASWGTRSASWGTRSASWGTRSASLGTKSASWGTRSASL